MFFPVEESEKKYFQIIMLNDITESLAKFSLWTEVRLP